MPQLAAVPTSFGCGDIGTFSVRAGISVSLRDIEFLTFKRLRILSTVSSFQVASMGHWSGDVYISNETSGPGMSKMVSASVTRVTGDSHPSEARRCHVFSRTSSHVVTCICPHILSRVQILHSISPARPICRTH